MEKIFLDTNIFIDIMEKRNIPVVNLLSEKTLFISTNTLGIWSYIYKISAFDINWEKITSHYNLIDYTYEIAERSCKGPTNDFEDNVQLHSAVACGADFFLTKDKDLLKLGYFGDMQLVGSL